MEDIYNREEVGRKVLIVTIIGNVVLTILKAIAGFVAGSTAMVSDAVHSLSDVLSTFVAMIGIKISHKPADEDHPYGHARAETVATKILAMLVAATGLGIGWAAVRSLINGQFTAPGQAAIWAALLSIVGKEWMYRYSKAKGEEINSKALIADAHHHRSDALSSITALFGILGGRLGFPILDPIAGLVVAILIVKVGAELYWESIQELVDRAPDKETLKEIATTTINTDGVINVHDIKARIHGPHVYVDLKICVNRFWPVYQSHKVAHDTVDHIKAHVPNVKDVLVHVNPCGHVANENDDHPHCKECTAQPEGYMLLGDDDLDKVKDNIKKYGVQQEQE